MTTRMIETEEERKSVVLLIESQKLPITVVVTKGVQRSLAQNRLIHKWYQEAAEQLEDDNADGYRAFCKLHFGIPLLRAENDTYREKYDEVIKPLPYELKLKAMSPPLDLACTSLMTTKQASDYLNAVYVHFTGLGCRLTQPEEMGIRRQ